MEITKSHVAKELPDERSLAECGIAVPLSVARVLLALMSRTLVHGKANHRTLLGRAAKMIALAVSLPIEDDEGFVIDALLPSPPTAFVPNGETAERKLASVAAGFAPSLLNRAMADGRCHVTSCLPLLVVLEYVPAPAWPYLAAFLACGPYEAADRISAAVSVRGKTMTAKSLDGQLTPVMTFMRIVASLRSEYEAVNDRREKTNRSTIETPTVLEHWTFVPAKLSASEVNAKAGGGRKRETSAVPPALITTRMHELARDAEWGKWKPEEWPFNRNWKALKDLVLLTLLAVLGPRIEHLTYLDARDVVLDCQFRDGTRGPAILFRGGDRGLKLRDANYEFAIRLPDGVRDLLVAWLSCNANESTQYAAAGQTPRVYDGLVPLIPAKRKREPGDTQGPQTNLGERVPGREPNAHTHGVRPLIPFSKGSFYGYQAHRFRSTVTQGIERLFKTWRDSNPGAELSGYDEHLVAELVLDHADKDLGYRDVRASGEPTARFEQLVSVGVQLLWESLWGDGPYLRRGLHPGAIYEAHEKANLIAAEIEMLGKQISELRSRASSSVDAALKRDDRSKQLDVLLKAHAVRAEIDEKVERREQLRKAYDEALAARERARVTEVLLPEDLTAEEHQRELAAVLSKITGNDADEMESTPILPLATEFTVADIAELFGVSPQHVGRWRKGQSSPPIDPAHWVQHNGKDFRYPASAVDEDTLRRVPAEDPGQRVNTILAQRALLGYAKGQEHAAVAA